MNAPQALAALATAVVACAGPGCLGAFPEAAPDPASIFSDTSVFPGTYDTSGPHSRPLIAGPHGILEARVVEISSALDGATIQIGIVQPDVPAGTRVPVLVDASPYYDPLTPERIEGNPKHDNVTFWTFDHYAYFAGAFVPHGYAVAYLALRGTGGSGGCNDEFGPATQHDLDQAVTWLASRTWSNGNVGMIGISAEATPQWMVAATGNPHLRTIVALGNGAPDLFRMFYVWNGTYVGGLSHLPIEPGGNPSDPASLLHRHVGDERRSFRHRAESLACPEAAQGEAAALHASTVTPERGPFAYWTDRSYLAAVEENYRGPLFAVNGQRDAFDVRVYPWVLALEARGVVVKHLFGQWGHRYPDFVIFEGDDGTHLRWDFAEILLRWLDRWLKDDATTDVGPAAQVQDSSGRWRSEPTWPPPDDVPRAFHLAPGGALAPDPGAPAGSVVLCQGPEAARPVAADACADVIRFASTPFGADLRFAGLPTLHATVTPRGPGGALHARLIVGGEGNERVVTEAWMDLRAAAGGEATRPVVPDAPLVARMEFHAADVVVPRGSRLVVEIRPGDARPPSAAPIEIATGGDASVLTVRAFERDADDPRFFTVQGEDS